MTLSSLARSRFGSVMMALALWASASHGMGAPAEGGGRVARVDAIRTTDHPHFVEQLAELHRNAAGLAPDDTWYLRFLDGWEINYEGRYPEAEGILRDVMAHAGDNALQTRATALLMNNLLAQGKYAEAYATSTRAADTLPAVTDPMARFVMLANLSQMLTFAGKPDLGLAYAEMMLKATPPGLSPCQAMVQKVTALEGSRRLNSQSPELLSTIDSCTADHQAVFANGMSLILVDRLFDEHKFDQALATNRRITPGIRQTNYFPHLIDLAAQRARVYEQQGNASEARKAALEAVAMSHPGDFNEAMRIAYHVLYSVEKAQGHFGSALDYYEHYVVQDQGYLRDANVRNIAYEEARQHFLSEKLESEGLSKENHILRLQRALDGKAAETNRLYIVALFFVLLSIIFWMMRIKRSQLRFKRLSSCDGLTGIFHHQHFMGETARVLRALEKRSSEGCLVFIDLDHFKQVNDTHGHAVGDAVLRHVVAACRGELRKGDLFGRLGGEEFGVLLVDMPRWKGAALAEHLRLVLAASPLVMDEVVVSFSASIGLACTETAGYDWQRLCRASDAALYRAKHRGRNCVAIDGDDDESIEAGAPSGSSLPSGIA